MESVQLKAGEARQIRPIETVRERRETRTGPPVTAALRSGEARTRREARAAVQNLLTTLKNVEEKKRNVEEAMALLLRETQAARRRRRHRLVSGTAFVTLMIGLIYLTRGKIFEQLWWILQLGGGAWAADRAASTRRDAAYALSKAGDPRAVGVLALALRDGDSYVRDVAERALRHLLPRVRASDAAYIAPDQMNALLHLGYSDDYGQNLKIPLLTALEQIGDARALPVVEYLHADPSPQVREAARECLPFVQERVRRARESATLLRASAATGAITPPDQLLRPAAAGMTPVTPPDQLLRAVEAQNAREQAPT
jgi:hypothetical protein